LRTLRNADKRSWDKLENPKGNLARNSKTVLHYQRLGRGGMKIWKTWKEINCFTLGKASSFQGPHTLFESRGTRVLARVLQLKNIVRAKERL
jgi:hypothetical protein